MARRFEIAELRSLVARALNDSDYTPAESARIRAVPDTRTIRYYTTLGLISPPAEMRGRVALYDETHVLQVVAIKRLQSQNLTLSDIQQQLVGLTPDRLTKLAKLPDQFWKAADDYLDKVDARADVANQTKSTDGMETREAAQPFWLRAPSMPENSQAEPGHSQEPRIRSGLDSITTTIRLQVDGITIAIELPVATAAAQPSTQQVDFERLHHAAQPIIDELRRQKLIEHGPSSSSET